MKSIKMLFAALLVAASITTVSANTPIGTLTGEPVTETVQQPVSSLNNSCEQQVATNAVVQMAYDYNRPAAPASDEVEVIKTKTLFINGKRIMVRPDGTLATKYAAHRTTRRTVRRSSNGSSLALKRAIAKTNATIKGVDKRLNNIEIGFDAVAKTAEKNQETAQKALTTANNAIANAKKTGKDNNNFTKQTGIIAVIALIIGIFAYLKRNREIGVSSDEFDEFVTENTAEHTDFAGRIQVLENAVGIGAPLPEAGTSEEAAEILAEEPVTDDTTTTTTTTT